METDMSTFGGGLIR